MRRAVFLDRDGVINQVLLKDGKPFSPREVSQLKILDNVSDFLMLSNRIGFVNIVVTNQPDIARGVLGRKTLDDMNSLLKKELAIDDIFVCPHDDSDNCCCRKPKPGMLLAAAEKWDIDLENSFLIGDQWKDIQAGKAAGCTTILLDYPYNQEVQADIRISNMKVAFSVITKIVESLRNG